MSVLTSLMPMFLQLNGKTLRMGSHRGLKQIGAFVKTVQIRSAAYWSSGNNSIGGSIKNRGNDVSNWVISMF